MAIKFSGSQEAADADSNFPVAPEGTIAYLTCVDAKEGMTKGNPSKGTPRRPMMELECVVAEGEYADKVRLWDYLTFIEAGGKGHGMTLHALHAWGFESEGENDYSAEEFKGRTVKAELGIDTYQGKRKNVIKKYIVDETPALAAPAPRIGTDEEEAVAAAPAAAPARAAAPVRTPAPAAPAKKLPWGKK